MLSPCSRRDSSPRSWRCARNNRVRTVVALTPRHSAVSRTSRPSHRAQHENRAEILRQRVDGVFEQRTRMRRFDELIGRWARRWPRPLPTAMASSPASSSDTVSPRVAPAHHQRLVERHARKPRAEFPAGLVAVELRESAQVGFLHRVLRGIASRRTLRVTRNSRRLCRRMSASKASRLWPRASSTSRSSGRSLRDRQPAGGGAGSARLLGSWRDNAPVRVCSRSGAVMGIYGHRHETTLQSPVVDRWAPWALRCSGCGSSLSHDSPCGAAPALAAGADAHERLGAPMLRRSGDRAIRRSRQTGAGGRRSHRQGARRVGQSARLALHARQAVHHAHDGLGIGAPKDP